MPHMHKPQPSSGLPPEGAVISVAMDREGHVYVCARYYPPLAEGRHVETKVEAITARMLRAAIDAGAREV